MSMIPSQTSNDAAYLGEPLMELINDKLRGVRFQTIRKYFHFIAIATRFYEQFAPTIFIMAKDN